MKRLIKIPRSARLALMAILALAILSCESETYKDTTDETQNITEFLRANTEDYSLFLEILDVTGYSVFINTYGTYTLFLPTDAAVEEYMNEMGVSQISDVPMEELQDLAKLHILEVTVPTTLFTDGKIAAPTMYGQYLITGAVNQEGQSSVTVNKTALITQSNIEVGNGIIHEIDEVLRVARKTLAETIEEDGNMTIFEEAIKATGYYELLDRPRFTGPNDTIPDYLTVLAQTDDVFRKAGFENFEEVKNRYSHLGEPMNPEDSLNLYVGYRIIPGLQYMADLAVTPAVETKAPLEVIGIKLSKDTLLLNEEIFNGVLEKGVAINRPVSDVTASNGVLHFVDDDFFIKKRLPAPVYFDVADQPEFRQLADIFRTPGAPYVELGNDQLSLVEWSGSGGLGYSQQPYAWHGDLIECTRFYAGWYTDMTFTSPVVIKGQYKVWLSYRVNTRGVEALRIYVDGVPLTRTVNYREYGNTELPERVLESQGYKRYAEPYDNRVNSKLLGIIDIETTGRHEIRFEMVSPSRNGQSWTDIIEFRPVDMDQLYPKFEANGPGLIFE